MKKKCVTEHFSFSKDFNISNTRYLSEKGLVVSWTSGHLKQSKQSILDVISSFFMSILSERG